MSNIERAKKKLELAKVKCAKQEMEYKILERQADIERLKEGIATQDLRIIELEQELNEE